LYDTSLSSVIDEVETLMAERLSARGRDLEQKLKHAGRRLPRKIRVQAQYLVEAQKRYKNPKRAAQYDPARVLAAHKACVNHLSKLDTKAMRARGRLAWFTGLLVNLFLIALLVAAAVYYLR